jgi:hypothetical protein
MIPSCYPSGTERINRGSRGTITRLVCALTVLAAGALSTSSAAVAEGAPGDRGDLALAWLVEHARAHPSALGSIRVVRHDHAFDRTVEERGVLALARDGLRVTLDGPAPIQLAARADRVELFDVASDTLLVLAQPTPLTAYAEVLAGADPGAWLAARALRDVAGAITVELVPRGTLSWLDAERLVLRIDAEGPDRGRIDRALVTWPNGDWVRFDLAELAYSQSLDPSRLELPPHPGARRISL